MPLAAATTFQETLVPARAAMLCTVSPAALSVSGVVPTEAEMPAEAEIPADADTPAETDTPAEASAGRGRDASGGRTMPAEADTPADAEAPIPPATPTPAPKLTAGAAELLAVPRRRRGVHLLEREVDRGPQRNAVRGEVVDGLAQGGH